jgi:thiol-disulfide isomerase/thioredoxin
MQKYVGDRNSFKNLLRGNHGTLIFKFGAVWCEPCKKVKGVVDALVAETLQKYPNGCVHFFDVDVDDCFDLYAFLKSKKMTRGIPALLRYDQDNDSYAPDCSVTGTDNKEIQTFFRMI